MVERTKAPNNKAKERNNRCVYYTAIAVSDLILNLKWNKNDDDKKKIPNKKVMEKKIEIVLFNELK